jgi:hypothetical protein
MSRIDSGNLGAAPDASLELAMAAASAQNASRPRYLIVLASLLLVGAVAYLLWVITAQGAAAAQLNKAKVNLDTLKATIAQVRSVSDTASRQLYEPNQRVVNLLTTSAEQMGLPGVLPSTAADIRNVKGYVIKQYSVSLAERDPSLLLAWLKRVTNDSEIPGLDLARVKFTPSFVLDNGKVGWNMEVTFRRWQRDT